MSEQTSIENLEVLVSTKSSDLKDFNLVERFSFADYFAQQHMEEVDLSKYAGQDIYVAFRCCSDKMQGYLWLWDVMVTDKLKTPVITKFERNGTALHAEWTPVEGATGYYLYFGKETDQVNQEAAFAPMSFYKEVTGDVDLSTGQLFFKSTGSVTLKEFEDGIEDCKFIVTTSGPLGTSELTVEGTKDMRTWQTVGPKTSLTQYDSEGQEVDLSSYLEGKNYKKLRFNFKHGGRNGRVKYLTLVYNNGKVWEDLAAGGVSGTSINIPEKTEGEFDKGRYKIWVASGWQNIFYDESAPVYYEKTTTAISDVIEGTSVMLTNNLNDLRLEGLKPGSNVTLTSSTGATLYTGTASGTSLTIPTSGMKGVAIVSVATENGTFRTKTIIR